MEFPEKIKLYTTIFEHIPRDDKPNRYLLKLITDNTEVAKLRWNYTSDYVEVIEIWINEDFRRQGIGTAIYDALQKITKKPLRFVINAMNADMKEFYKKYKTNCDILLDEAYETIIQKK